MKEYLTCPEYEQLKKKYMHGWKTWNVHSVFSYVHMPDALTLDLCFKEYQDGNFLKNALIGRFPTDDPEDATEVLFPGDHAMDDSYTAMRMQWDGLEVLVETAAEDDTFALLVTPVKDQRTPVRLYLQGGYLWNHAGTVKRIAASSQDREALYAVTEQDDIWIIRSAVQERTGGAEGAEASAEEDRNVPLTGPYLSLLLTGQAAFLARKQSCDTGDCVLYRQPEQASDILQEARSLVEKKKRLLHESYRAYGDEGWMAQAMECVVSWDTVYDANHDRVISPVSRLWSIRKGGYVLFCWDNFFAGYMAGAYGRALAYSNVIGIVNERTEQGFVPNMSCGNGMKTKDRSQPPVGSRIVLELYKKYRDLWLVKLLYPSLLRWNEWFFANRRAGSGALCWGSDPAPVFLGNRWEIDGVHDRFGGALESGLDNSPMYDDIPFDAERNCLMLEDVGLTGLYIMDCMALRELAEVLGQKEDAAELLKRQACVEQGLERLWDEENGFYYNRRTDTGAFSRRISPTNFYALFSDAVPEERIGRILREHYYNPEEFYGDWMLPSIARNDPAFADQDYWRGRVWAPLNFLVYLAFEQHFLTEECRDLAEKSRRIFKPEWDEKRHVHENYNAITGEGCDAHNSDKFYHWGALLSAIVLRHRVV